MKCVKCDTVIESGEKFCSGCGAVVSDPPSSATSFCSECGCKLQPGEKFCSECGATVEVPAVPIAPKAVEVAKSTPVVSVAPSVPVQTIKAAPLVPPVEKVKPQPAPVSVSTSAPSPKATPVETPKPAPQATAPVPTPKPPEVKKTVSPTVSNTVAPQKSSSPKAAIAIAVLLVAGGGAFFLTKSPKPADVQVAAPVAEVKAVAPAPEAPVAPKAAPVEPVETVIAGPTPSSASVQKLIDAALTGNKEEFQSLTQQLQQRPVTPMGDRKAARKLNDEALKAMKEQNAAMAVDLLQQARSTDPADVEIGDNLAYALRQAGKLQDAETQIIKVLDQAPSRMSAWFNLGETYSKLGKHQQAVAIFITSHGLSKDPQKALEGFNRTLDRSEDEGFKNDLREAIKKLTP